MALMTLRWHRKGTILKKVVYGIHEKYPEHVTEINWVSGEEEDVLGLGLSSYSSEDMVFSKGGNPWQYKKKKNTRRKMQIFWCMD